MELARLEIWRKYVSLEPIKQCSAEHKRRGLEGSQWRQGAVVRRLRQHACAIRRRQWLPFCRRFLGHRQSVKLNKKAVGLTAFGSPMTCRDGLLCHWMGPAISAIVPDDSAGCT